MKNKPKIAIINWKSRNYTVWGPEGECRAGGMSIAARSTLTTVYNIQIQEYFRGVWVCQLHPLPIATLNPKKSIHKKY